MNSIILNGDQIQESDGFKNLEKPLIDLIAQTSIWVDPKKVSRHPIYPDKRRGASKEKGKVLDGIKIDDNTYANLAIKTAISKDIDFINYTTCHIWPGTAYDERYHTLLSNLVLIPRVLAGLSDFCSAVVDVLKYRAWELYRWYPKEETIPTRPNYYPEKWNSFISDNGTDSRINCNDLDDVDHSDLITEDDNKRLAIEEYNNNREEIEIEKVMRKIPNWMNKTHQINSIILNNYKELSKNGVQPVSVDLLKSHSEADGVEKFEGNYNQMKNFGINNHAKVFQEKDGYVYLWEPISTYVKLMFTKG